MEKRVFFVHSQMFFQKRLKMAEKKCFNQLSGVRSTRKLVKIHNSLHLL